MDIVDPTNSNTSQVPYYARINRENLEWLANSVYKYVMDFIQHNLAWLKETGGLKTWLIKIPDAVVSISNRIGPATHRPGKMINIAADMLMPLHALGGCASTLLGFAEVGSKFPAMFSPAESKVQYVVRDEQGKVVRDEQRKAWKAHFDLNYLDKIANKALSIADWTLSFTGCAGYIWKLNHSADEKFPLVPIATWSARVMSIKGLYSEGRFLYETCWVGNRHMFDKEKKVAISDADSDIEQDKIVPMPISTVAWEEVAGSVLKISLSVACLGLDVLKLAAKESQSPWLDTAVFCAGLAPTFITPVAMRYWPKMAVEPLYAAPSA
jgi:hypothetical protein